MDGKRLLEAPPIVLTDWVCVGVEYGRSFQYGARLDHRGLLLRWQAQSAWDKGAAPTRAQEEAARRSATGVFVIDLQTGKSESINQEGVFKSIPLANEFASVKLGAVTFSIKDSPTNNVRNLDEMRRTLVATDADGRVMWERAIAAPVRLRLRK
jgi:hypothetical protein